MQNMDVLEFPIWVNNINCGWRSILNKGQLRKLPKGSMIMSNVINSAGFYFLEEGLVKLALYPSYTAQPSPILIIREGTLFGEVPEFVHSLNATFECLVPCTTYFFPFETIYNEDFVTSYPNIMLELAQSLSVKLNRISMVLCQRISFNSAANVARYLYTIDKYIDEKALKYCILAHQELASMLGIHRSTLSAILKELKDKNILERYTKYKVEIKNKDKLIEYIFNQIEKKDLSNFNLKPKLD